MDKFPCSGFLGTVGWHGIALTEVRVIGETPTKFRIKAIKPTKLGGRNRWLNKDDVILVPKTAVRI